jgi:hypothetical protein
MDCSSLESSTWGFSFSISDFVSIQAQTRWIFVEKHALRRRKKRTIFLVVGLYDPKVIVWLTVYLLTTE